MNKIRNLFTLFSLLSILILSTGCEMSTKYEIHNTDTYNSEYESLVDTLVSGEYDLANAILDTADVFDDYYEDYHSGEYELEPEEQDYIYAIINSIADGSSKIITESSEEKEKVLREVKPLLGNDFTDIIDEVISKEIELAEICYDKFSKMKNKYDGKPLDRKYYSELISKAESNLTYKEGLSEHVSNVAIAKLFGVILNTGFSKSIEGAFSSFY